MNPKFFVTLREANLARLPTYHNSKGQQAHTHKAGKDWSTAQWLQAVVGELGEYANCRKKLERGDMDLQEFIPLAQAELADILTYLDILALQHDVDFTISAMTKINLAIPKHPTPADWVQLIVVHLGKYADMIQPKDEDQWREKNRFIEGAARNLNSVVLCLINLALQLEINLGEATFVKFNVISERIGSPVFIDNGTVQFRLGL